MDDKLQTREQMLNGLSAAPEEGWIEWSGGECPVPKRTLVDVKTRDGDFGMFLFAGTCDYEERSEGGSMAYIWEHDHDDEGSDIVAYRVVSA